MWEERAVWALALIGAYLYAWLVDRAQRKNARHAKTLAQELHRLSEHHVETLFAKVDALADQATDNANSIEALERGSAQMARGVRSVLEACGVLEQAGEAS